MLLMLLLLGTRRGDHQLLLLLAVDLWEDCAQVKVADGGASSGWNSDGDGCSSHGHLLLKLLLTLVRMLLMSLELVAAILATALVGGMASLVIAPRG